MSFHVFFVFFRFLQSGGSSAGASSTSRSSAGGKSTDYSEVLLGKNIPGLTISVIPPGSAGADAAGAHDLSARGTKRGADGEKKMVTDSGIIRAAASSSGDADEAPLNLSVKPGTSSGSVAPPPPLKVCHWELIRPLFLSCSTRQRKYPLGTLPTMWINFCCMNYSQFVSSYHRSQLWICNKKLRDETWRGWVLVKLSSNIGLTVRAGNAMRMRISVRCENFWQFALMRMRIPIRIAFAFAF